MLVFFSISPAMANLLPFFRFLFGSTTILHVSQPFDYSSTALVDGGLTRHSVRPDC